MNKLALRGAVVTAVTSIVLMASACSTNQVAENTGDALGFVGRTTVKVVAGAGELAYEGGAALVNAAGSE